MDEELRFHIDMEAEKLVREGLDPHEARRRALAAFGGLDRHRDQLRQGRRVPVLEAAWHDLRFGARFLARAPGLSLVAALTIALGIGATTTVFSVVENLILKPLPIPGAHRLVSVQEDREGMWAVGIEGMLIRYDRYEAYRRASGEVFESLAAYRLVDAFSLRLPEVTLAVNGELTSGNYFQTLGVRPVLGRAYSSDNANEIVISHQLWLTRFGGDRGVIGRTVGLEGRSLTVVGVAPASFGGATFVADQVWAPVGIRGDDRRAWTSRVVPLGRLRTDVSIEQAGAEVEALARSIPPDEATTVRSARLDRLSVVPLAVREQTRLFFTVLLGMALLVLLIAAANIAGVMLARGLARRREMAVRLAIGAGRTRLVRHLLAESLMLFAAGGGAGVALAYLGTTWLARLELPLQVPDLLLSVEPDGRVLAFAVVLTGVTGVLFGLVPALQASRPDLVPALKIGPEGSVGGRGVTRGLFVGGQIALSVTLLLTAALFARSLQRGLNTDLGFDPDGVVAATIDLGSLPGYDRERGLAFYRELLSRVRALPGVRDAALSQSILLSGNRSGSMVRPPGEAEAPSVFALRSAVSPGYLETMGIPLGSGRDFNDTDAEDSPPVVIVNQTLADRVWPGRSPVGQLLGGIGGEQPAEVVGVTPPGRYAYRNEEPAAFFFVPWSQAYQASMAINVRVSGAGSAILRALAGEVRSIDPDVALGAPRRVSDLANAGLFPQRVAAELVGGFGMLGLILAALGIYGVLAHQIARRSREIGVRRALGATSLHIVGGVVKRGATLAAAGCMVGIGAGAALAHVLRSFHFGIRPLDPVTFTAVPALLFAVALLASWLPARRANAIEAVEALKSE